MPRLERSAYQPGMFITGAAYRSELMSSAAPVIYGKPLPLPKPDFGEIERRLDEARRRLGEIAAAARRRT